MGLAGTKKRTKITHDPNNTNWTSSTTTYGHKILSAHGWTPGTFLGARSAPHSSHYTAANASHVRVLLKDDNLGLGAKKGSNAEETFGLGALQGLLGRLNGKAEEDILAERRRREDVARGLWVERKFGGMRFVKGGLLVGNRIMEEEEHEGPNVLPCQTNKAKTDTKITTQADAGRADDGISGKTITVNNRERKRKRRDTRQDQTTHRGMSANTSTNASAAPSTSASSDEKENRKRAKQERKAQRAAKRTEREGAQIKTAKVMCKEEQLDAPPLQSSGKDKIIAGCAATSSRVSHIAPLPTPFTGGRHAVRQRYIAQKRMASMDPQALKEIFMLKA